MRLMRQILDVRAAVQQLSDCRACKGKQASRGKLPAALPAHSVKFSEVAGREEDEDNIQNTQAYAVSAPAANLRVI